MARRKKKRTKKKAARRKGKRVSVGSHTRGWPRSKLGRRKRRR